MIVWILAACLAIAIVAAIALWIVLWRTRERAAETDTIVEEYSCDPNGIVQVTLRSLESGFARTYRLAQSLK